MEKAGCFLQVPAASWIQAVPGNTGSWGALAKALGGEQVLEASRRELPVANVPLEGGQTQERAGEPLRSEQSLKIAAVRVEGWMLHGNGALELTYHKSELKCIFRMS